MDKKNNLESTQQKQNESLLIDQKLKNSPESQEKINYVNQILGSINQRQKTIEQRLENIQGYLKKNNIYESNFQDDQLNLSQEQSQKLQNLLDYGKILKTNGDFSEVNDCDEQKIPQINLLNKNNLSPQVLKMNNLQQRNQHDMILENKKAQHETQQLVKEFQSYSSRLGQETEWQKKKLQFEIEQQEAIRQQQQNLQPKQQNSPKATVSQFNFFSEQNQNQKNYRSKDYIKHIIQYNNYSPKIQIKTKLNISPIQNSPSVQSQQRSSSTFQGNSQQNFFSQRQHFDLKKRPFTEQWIKQSTPNSQKKNNHQFPNEKFLQKNIQMESAQSINYPNFEQNISPLNKNKNYVSHYSPQRKQYQNQLPETQYDQIDYKISLNNFSSNYQISNLKPVQNEQSLIDSEIKDHSYKINQQKNQFLKQQTDQSKERGYDQQLINQIKQNNLQSQQYQNSIQKEQIQDENNLQEKILKFGKWIVLDNQILEQRMKNLVQSSKGDLRIVESYFQSSLFQTRQPLILFDDPNLLQVKIQKCFNSSGIHYDIFEIYLHNINLESNILVTNIRFIPFDETLVFKVLPKNSDNFLMTPSSLKKFDIKLSDENYNIFLPIFIKLEYKLIEENILNQQQNQNIRNIELNIPSPLMPLINLMNTTESIFQNKWKLVKLGVNQNQVFQGLFKVDDYYIKSKEDIQRIFKCLIPVKSKALKQYFKFVGICYFKAQVEYLIRIFFHPQNLRMVIQISTDQLSESAQDNAVLIIQELFFLLRQKNYKKYLSQIQEQSQN